MSDLSLDDCETIFGVACASDSQLEFQHAISPLLDFYEVLNFEFGRGTQFYRARTYESHPYANQSELSYPPSNLVGVNRLNDANTPCMYLAARKETAIAEIDATEDRLVQIAGFRIKPEEHIRFAVVGELSHIQKTGRMFSVGSAGVDGIEAHLNSMPYRRAQALIYIDRFFFSVISNNEANLNNYLLSRALGKSLLKASGADGIMYPSVKDDRGLNIAIPPNVADRAIHNTSCVLARTKSRLY